MLITCFTRQPTLPPRIIFCFHSTPRRAVSPVIRWLSRTRLALVCTAFTATALFGVSSHAASLNDTGQTQCFDGAGATISCSVSDDGRYGRDAAAAAGALTKIGGGIAGFDFTKIANNGSALAASAALGPGATDWACTRDNVTGLTWEVKTTGTTDLRYSGHSYTWYNTNSAENGGNAGSAGVVNTCNGTLPSNQCNTQAFVAAVNAAALCGYSDWHLPTPRELRSIVNYGAGNPMDATYFLTTARPNFWSASTHARTPAYAWVVSVGVDDGGGDGHAHVKTNDDLARLVRGGLQSAPSLGACTAGNPNANVVGSTPSADFTDNGNGTVTHAKTGLMWKRCAEGLSGATCATGAATTVTWSNALATAESSSFAGFTDWRLPNLKELHSIVETCGYDPAINQSIFPATPAPAFGSVFWSATSSASDPAKAAIFVFGGGGGVPDNKASRMHARLVRGGQSFDSFDSQAVAPQSGWWWNPTQSGRGFSIELQGNNLFMAGYLYADDGRATWLVSGGAMTNSSTYGGPLLAFGGGQTLSGPYKPSTLANPNVGNLTLQFSDASHGTLTWPGGTIPIERFPFGSGVTSFQPQTGWWWNAAESGRGFFIETQGNNLFMAGYMYDSSGNPIWYISGGTISSTLYQGSWLQFANGQTLTGTYQPPSQPPANAGVVTLQFASTTTATLTLPDGRQISLTRFPF